ncbi:protein MFI-like isoform X4 [Gadus macrocephalus]|uniref:protein MFI-like isoform X4 n=1 Tax=Gadus macrocephalus TaxID=80720 RepID=UPI0028CB16CB|nr:protein MFI-like isoform X4 [Gadus macrocephalus]
MEIHAGCSNPSIPGRLLCWMLLRGCTSDSVSVGFPPSIYYKIFTHRPIVDMCANSPKDYTLPGHKCPVPRQTHNGLPLIPENRSTWYRRVENNGWRLLSGKLGPLCNPVELDADKKMEFHHCKLQRRRDLEQRRRKRKIEWMRQMYNHGRHLQAPAVDPEEAVLVERSLQGMIQDVERCGTANHSSDWEVDELQEWTTVLNFEDYMTEWTSLALSHSSEHFIAPQQRFPHLHRRNICVNSQAGSSFEDGD